MTSAKPSEKAKNPEQNNSEEKNIEFTKTEEGQKHIIDIVQKDLLQTKSQEKNQQIGYLQLILSCFFGILITLLISYYSLQREFLQTKIEQQNERIKQLEQKQNLVLSAKK